MSPLGGVCKSAGRIIRNGRTSPAGGYRSFCVSLRFCPRLPRRQASDRRLVAGQPHGTLTPAGFSADRAFRLRKYHYPSLTVIAFRGSQSRGRVLAPDLSSRSCHPVANSLLRQRERICLMAYSVVNVPCFLRFALLRWAVLLCVCSCAKNRRDCTNRKES